MFRKSSTAHSVCLAFLLTVPAMLLTGAGAMAVYEIWEDFRTLELGYYEQIEQNTRWMQFRKDGTPVVRVTNYSVNMSTRRPGQVEHYETLDGERLAETDRSEFLWGVSPQVRALGNMAPLKNDPFEYQFKQRSEKTQPVKDPFDTRLSWSLKIGNSDDRYYEARDRQGNIREYCSRSGFTSTPPKSADWFRNPNDFRVQDSSIVFRSDGELIGIDLKKRAVVSFSKLDDHQAWTLFNSELYGEGVLVVRNETLSWFKLSGKEILQVEVPDAARREISCYFRPDAAPVIISSSRGRSDSTIVGTRSMRSTQIAYLFDDSGAVAQTYEFEGETENTRTFDAPRVVILFEQLCNQAATGFVLPSPGVTTLFHFAVVPILFRAGTPDAGYDHSVAEAFALWPYGLHVAFLFGALCAWSCFRRQRRYSADHTKLWVLFVFFFGVPGWIGWRLHRRWPPLSIAGIPDAEFICPEPNGLEILEPAAQPA